MPTPRGLAVALAAGALVATALGAGAAITGTSTSTLTTSTTPAPVALEMGAGGANVRYFTSFALGANATLVSGAVSGKAGADLVVKDVLRVVSRSASAQSVTLSSTQVSNARVEVFAWTLREGAATVGVLDHLAAAPGLSFTLGAGQSRTLDLRLDLADGAGLDNAAFAFDLRLGVAAGGVSLSHASAPALAPAAVEAPFGRLAAGSAVGANATNATASAAGALVATTTDLLYLNNTNPTQPAYARLVLTSSSGLAQVVSLTVGIRNGTSQSAQVAGAGGSVTQPSGSYLRLEPASANRIYLTQAVSVLFAGGSTLDMDAHVADDAAEAARVVSKLRVTIT